MKALKEYIVESNRQFRDIHDIYELINEKNLWTDKNGQSICFYSKQANVREYSSLDTFDRGCSLIMFFKNDKGEKVWTLLKPQQRNTNIYFDFIVKSFHGKLVETIQGESELQFAQRGPVNPTNEQHWTIDIYTFDPNKINMKKLKTIASASPVYTIPYKGAPTGMAAFDKKYYWDPFKKYMNE